MKERTLRINYFDRTVRIGSISGTYYTVPGNTTDNLVIYGIGAPMIPDFGYLDDASYIMDFDTDLFVPDYIGYGRSEGVFTPQNTIKTFLQLYDDFTQGVKAISHYEHFEKKLCYKNIYFVGASFGGAYVTLLPRYNTNIRNICALFPVLDWSQIGKKDREETVEQFFNAMIQDGYQYMYRGILRPEWKKHFKGEDDLSPIDNIQYMQNARLFIGHGKNDSNIHYSNSQRYFSKLTERFPQNSKQYMLKLYAGDHGPATSNLGIQDYLSWIQMPRVK